MIPRLKRGVSAVRARNSTLATRCPPPGGTTTGRASLMAPNAGRRALRLVAPCGLDGARLLGVHPHLPAPGRGPALVEEAVGPAALELRRAQPEHAAEDRRDAPARPADRVLDLAERARAVGDARELREQGAHEVAAAVVERGDLAGVGHRVLRGVLDEVGGRRDARHGPATLPAGGQSSGRSTSGFAGRWIQPST